MALRKTVIFRGVEIENAYHRIADMSGKKEDGVFKIWFSVFVQCDSTTQPLEQKQNDIYAFTYDLGSSSNAIKQAYDYMKTLDEYEDAEDI